MATKRIKRVGSVKQEFLSKSREAALAAVQVFNNPAMTFKSEIYAVLMVIAWTYLMHAYYRSKKIEHRYFTSTSNGRKRFNTTAKGAHKYWGLYDCLKSDQSPVDKDATNNLYFIIDLRHEIEHRMTTRIDQYLSARFQACCLNYNEYIKKLFGESQGIDKHLAFSLQFASLTEDHVNQLAEHSGLPQHIQTFVDGFDGNLSEEEYRSPRFAYRVLFVPKTANTKGQADKVIEFIKADSELAQSINSSYAVIKETEREKYLPGQIVKIIQSEGFPKFSQHVHTKFWQMSDAKNAKYSYGTKVVGQWYWYEKWVNKVRDYCKKNAAKFQ